MARGRVLLVDDSVVVRKVVAEYLATSSDVEVVATASNGRIALEKLAQVNPDLVILDVEMPEMDGIATLTALRVRAPKLPVLMFSALTERAGAMTLEALSLGASDYVTKPSNLNGAAGPARALDELMTKTRALLARSSEPPALVSALPSAAAAVLLPVPRAPAGRVDLLAIGSSTGGPNALAEIIASLPAGFPVPIVIAQHMPPLFTRLFADRLESQSQLRVREGATGEPLRPGEVWIAPGDFHLTVRQEGEDRLLLVHQGMPENSCRPSVDVLFRSVADAYGSAALGVVLTGMGMDGLRGCERIREAGGQVVVQDEASSVVWSMPGSVAKAGLADEVVSLAHMGPTLLRRVSRFRGDADRAIADGRRER